MLSSFELTGRRGFSTLLNIILVADKILPNTKLKKYHVRENVYFVEGNGLKCDYPFYGNSGRFLGGVGSCFVMFYMFGE